MVFQKPSLRLDDLKKKIPKSVPGISNFSALMERALGTNSGFYFVKRYMAVRTLERNISFGSNE